jgi:hypothetical protein
MSRSARRFGACLAAALVVCVVSIAPTASAAPRAHKSSAAAVVGTKLAEGGARYLIGQLKTGALGSTGQDVGNFLTHIGLYDDTKERLAAIESQLELVNQRLAALEAQVSTLNTKIDQLGSAVANGAYSTHVALANPLRSAVIQGQHLLLAVARGSTPEERAGRAKTFAEFYAHRLRFHEVEFERYLTGGAVGADGILQLASKKSRAAAQPFYTNALSMFTRDVYNDYAFVQAAWLELEINYLHHEGKSHDIEASIANTEGALTREWRAVPSGLVFPNTVIDTRSGLLWTWTVDSGTCFNLTSTRAVNTCIYGRAEHVARAPYDASHTGSKNLQATNGSPPAGWRRATTDEVLALDSGWSGTPASWLHAKGGFPKALTGLVWTAPKSGTTAVAVDQTTGATATRAATESHHTLLTGDSGIPYFQFWAG